MNFKEALKDPKKILFSLQKRIWTLSLLRKLLTV